ncbi:hypothetical protein HDU89_000720 [Geranomyces variabilis]|nr:hypothetical protein HDU89_000720 [Geranomyces variabilis]
MTLHHDVDPTLEAALQSLENRLPSPQTPSQAVEVLNETLRTMKDVCARQNVRLPFLATVLEKLADFTLDVTVAEGNKTWSIRSEPEMLSDEEVEKLCQRCSSDIQGILYEWLKTPRKPPHPFDLSPTGGQPGKLLTVGDAFHQGDMVAIANKKSILASFQRIIASYVFYHSYKQADTVDKKELRDKWCKKLGLERFDRPKTELEMISTFISVLGAGVIPVLARQLNNLRSKINRGGLTKSDMDKFRDVAANYDFTKAYHKTRRPLGFEAEYAPVLRKIIDGGLLGLQAETKGEGQARTDAAIEEFESLKLAAMDVSH